MFNHSICVWTLAIFLVSVTASAQYLPDTIQAAGPQILPLSQVREGMRGTAKTVFRGTRSEEFNVEILGVIPNWIGPRQDVIIGKLSGANAERTFVFAGMSGSPVYVDGKLIGAISYSFPFAKEPICGITPIEQMISVIQPPTAARASGPQPRSFTFAEITANLWRPNTGGYSVANNTFASGFQSDSRLMAIAGQSFVPISTPVYFSGLSQATLDALSLELSRVGILPVAASGGGSGIASMKKPDATTLLGGDSVVVHLARGDVQIAAAGTVTLRDGDKIYAFGHPFFGLGSTDLPMSESHVVTVVPNANNSFKLAVPDATVGAMTQDRATAIYGSLGKTPKMLPVKIRLTTSRGRSEEVNFESAFDELLTPLIINAGIGNTLSANERGIGDSTIELNGLISIKGEEPIRINRRFAGAQAVAFAASAPAIPLSALLRANFEGLDITGVTINMTASDGAKTAALDRIAINHTQVKAGETIDVTVFERAESGRIVMQTLPVVIPKDTAPGPLSINVGDGGSIQQNSALTQFTPKTAAELVSIFNRIKRPDRVYFTLTRTSTGTIVGASEMPNLPPSFIATINNDRTAGGSKPTVQTILSEGELPPGEYIVSGSQTIAIEVVR